MGLRRDYGDDERFLNHENSIILTKALMHIMAYRKEPIHMIKKSDKDFNKFTVMFAGADAVEVIDLTEEDTWQRIKKMHYSDFLRVAALHYEHKGNEVNEEIHNEIIKVVMQGKKRRGEL